MEMGTFIFKKNKQLVQFELNEELYYGSRCRWLTPNVAARNMSIGLAAGAMLIAWWVDDTRMALLCTALQV